MGIVGVGSQILEVARVRHLLDRHADAFLARVFTAAEQAHCGGRVHAAEHYAAVWAAKEATLRSLGLAWHRGLPWTDIAVEFGAGRPTLTLAGAVAASAAESRVTAWHLTLAHCRSHATATVIATRG